MPLDEEFKIDRRAMMEMVERREAAMRTVTPCEYCGSVQVQLVTWHTPELKFKCRECKTVWHKKSPV